MRQIRFGFVLIFCVAAGLVMANAQSRRAGLWEVKSQTTIAQQGNPGGTLNGNGASSTEKITPLPVCMTQALIDKYGVILPPSLRDCDLSHVVQKPNSFSAEMTCKGSYNGRGSIESTWTDDEHATGKIRFVARSRQASKPLSMTWTQEASAVFKGPDCGDVKPRVVPPKSPAK